MESEYVVFVIWLLPQNIMLLRFIRVGVNIRGWGRFIAEYYPLVWA